MFHTKDFTTGLLDMEHMVLQNIEKSERQFVLHVEMVRRTHACLKCGALTDAISDNQKYVRFWTFLNGSGRIRTRMDGFSVVSYML